MNENKFLVSNRAMKPVLASIIFTASFCLADDVIFFSNGATATTVGKNTFFSGGGCDVTATTVGKNTFFSDGVTATTVGKNTFFSGGGCDPVTVTVKKVDDIFDPIMRKAEPDLTYGGFFNK